MKNNGLGVDVDDVAVDDEVSALNLDLSVVLAVGGVVLEQVRLWPKL